MPHKPVPYISIVVPVFNESRNLGALLHSIEKLNWPEDRRELILVDNGSTDGSDDILKDAGRNGAVVVQEQRRGSYAARNAGAAVARGEIFAFTDADCRPEPQWLLEGIGFLRHNGLDLVAGNVLQTMPEHRTLFDIVDRSIYLRQEWYAAQGFGATANLFVSAAAYRSVGGFDSRMQSSGDRLFCEKAGANGFRLGFCSEAVVSHPTRSSLSSIARKELRLGFGFGQLARLHPEEQGLRLFRETFLPVRGVRGCLRVRPTHISMPMLVAALTCYGLVRIPFRTWGFLRAWNQHSRDQAILHSVHRPGSINGADNNNDGFPHSSS